MLRPLSATIRLLRREAAAVKGDKVAVEQRYCRGEDVVLRSIAGEHFLIVLHAGESKMFSLNGMGLWFWNRLEKPVAKADLVSAMLGEYDVDEETARAEADRFMDFLTSKRLARLAV